MKVYDNTLGDDLTGKKFGKFTVIGRVQTHNLIMWDCLCECGRHRNKSTSQILNFDQNGGCGFCRRYPPVDEYQEKHRYYSTWKGMINRCHNPSSRSYKYYGGRGIIVCDEWRNDFDCFYAFVSHLDHFGDHGRSLDRIDNNGNYCPGNVRWATSKEQNNNKRKRGECNVKDSDSGKEGCNKEI